MMIQLSLWACMLVPLGIQASQPSYASPSSTLTTDRAISPTPSFTPNETTVDDLWIQIEVHSPIATAAKSNLMNSTDVKLSPFPPPFLPVYLSQKTKNMKFPPGFKYGVASSAPQIEGAAKEDGKGPSVWDYGPHVYPEMYTGTTDITDDFYHRYKNDLARLKAMGINTFMLSIAWTRIYPLGSGAVNEPGLAFYDKVVDEAIKSNIQPVITLFHWDTPLALSAHYGSWVSPKIIEDFNQYTETVFRRFGNRVKMWITFNEPSGFCSQLSLIPHNLTYPEGINAINAPYHCAHNLLVAHGTAVRTYRKLIKDGVIAAGQIGMKSDEYKPTPWSDSKEDKEASDRYVDFRIGIFAKPIFVDGDYPTTVKQTVGDLLPPLTREEQKLINGSADFYAQDLYRINYAKAAPNGIKACMGNKSDLNWPICRDERPQYIISTPGHWTYGQLADPTAPQLVNSWFALRDQLKYLTKAFPSRGGIYISEFGWAEAFENTRTELYQIVSDYGREKYFMDYLNEFLLAIHEDKIDLRGIFAWGIYDNYEWLAGVTGRYGLQYVNFTDPALPRHFKRSFYAIRNVMQHHLEAKDFNV